MRGRDARPRRGGVGGWGGDEHGVRERGEHLERQSLGQRPAQTGERREGDARVQTPQVATDVVVLASGRGSVLALNSRLTLPT
jgi:hypothetical protein